MKKNEAGRDRDSAGKISKKIRLELTVNGICSYLPGRTWISQTFWAKKLDTKLYEALINKGFRRCGYHFYQNCCPECEACIPIRLDIAGFSPSKSQRRALKKNSDIKIVRHKARFEKEGFSLYSKYCMSRHGSRPAENDYTNFLIDSPVDTQIMRYYCESQLVGLGWIDVLPDSLSSVYFAFDPDHAWRSMGVYSLLKEVELCQTLKKRWLQMGFWVEDCQKMSYKNNYKPCHYLKEGKWQD